MAVLNDLDKAVKILNKGGVIVYPTDTVYGIGGDATKQKVVDRIRKIKGGNAKKPMSVVVRDLDMAWDFCEISGEQELIIKKYLPGPFTFLLLLKKEMPVTTNDRVGIRIPDHEFVLDLMERLEFPLVSTSANKAGEKPPKEPAEIDEDIKNQVDLVVERGGTKYIGASTVVDLVDNFVVRQGAGVYEE